MFMKNAHQNEIPAYTEAARRCGIDVHFGPPNITEVQKGNDDRHTFAEYKSIHLPYWLLGNALISFKAAADSIIAELPNINTNVAPHMDQSIVAAFTSACDIAYDPNEELDPVDSSVWKDYFKSGHSDPKRAVELHTDSVFA